MEDVVKIFDFILMILCGIMSIYGICINNVLMTLLCICGVMFYGNEFAKG